MTLQPAFTFDDCSVLYVNVKTYYKLATQFCLLHMLWELGLGIFSELTESVLQTVRFTYWITELRIGIASEMISNNSQIRYSYLVEFDSEIRIVIVVSKSHVLSVELQEWSLVRSPHSLHLSSPLCYLLLVSSSLVNSSSRLHVSSQFSFFSVLFYFRCYLKVKLIQSYIKLLVSDLKPVFV